VLTREHPPQKLDQVVGGQESLHDLEQARQRNVLKSVFDVLDEPEPPLFADARALDCGEGVEVPYAWAVAERPRVEQRVQERLKDKDDRPLHDPILDVRQDKRALTPSVSFGNTT
jgi:hypothetical protein